MRTTDIVARLSGDELAVLMPQTDVEGAMQLGEDLRAQVAESARPAPEADPVTISVGISMYGPEHPEGHEAVLIAADQAMYQAKEEGRNQHRPLPRPRRAAAQAAPHADDDGEDPRRAHQRPPQPPHASRSTASPRVAGSSATSCCCG